MSNVRKRVEWIDSLKGLAIVLVVIFHCVDGYLRASLYADKLLIVALRNMNAFLANLRMPVFFVISGYLFYYVDKNYSWSKLKSKLAGMGLIYLIFEILHIIVQFFLINSVNIPPKFSDIVLLPFYPVHQYWYLYVLILYYLLAYQVRNINIVYILFISFIISITSRFYGDIQIFTFNRITIYIFFFFLGGYLCEYRVDLKRYWHLTWGLIVIYFAIYILNLEHSVSSTLMRLMLTSIFILMFANLKFLSSNKFLTICGKYSLPIYLLHIYFTSGTRIILNRIHITNIYIHLLSGIILAIIIPILIYKFCLKSNRLSVIFNPAKLWQKKD